MPAAAYPAQSRDRGADLPQRRKLPEPLRGITALQAQAPLEALSPRGGSRPVSPRAVEDPGRGTLRRGCGGCLLVVGNVRSGGW